ncbi:MAG: MgtC/SapB family protein [Planctomycetaceae bacterium]|nr:MgtC/SapB family protein [Planctomycetaceae bacterium]
MSTWELIGETIRGELSDLPDVAAFVRVVFRLTMAALLGGVLGFERESKGKAAGMRTHMIVALGAAIFVLVPQQAGADSADLSRVLQGLVAGIGFLGAGSILKGSSQEGVKGLTTAASIWLTAAIGMTAGMGREATAVVATALALGILALLPNSPQSTDAHSGDDGRRATTQPDNDDPTEP